MPATLTDLPQELLDQVRALSPAQKAALRVELDPVDQQAGDPETVRAARREMLAARIAEYQRGEVEAYSVEETLAAMDEAIREAEEKQP